MLKKFICSAAICFGLIFSMSQSSFAQDKTKDELKAEREVLASEMKSKDAGERKEKIEKLDQPKNTGVASIDGLATSSTSILTSTKSINLQIPELYKRTINEPDENGVTDITVKKPTTEELGRVALTIASQIQALASATASVAGASADVKGVSPMQMGKATKALNYSKEALALAGPELQMNLKVINNLIATVKSANNN